MSRIRSGRQIRANRKARRAPRYRPDTEAEERMLREMEEYQKLPQEERWRITVRDTIIIMGGNVELFDEHWQPDMNDEQMMALYAQCVRRV